jgi:hypothetical protein
MLTRHQLVSSIFSIEINNNEFTFIANGIQFLFEEYSIQFG